MKRLITLWLSALLLIAILLSSCTSPATPTTVPVTEPPQAQTEAPKDAEPPAATEEVKPTEAMPATKEAQQGMLPVVNPGEVTGDIITAGSSTVFPLTERMAERFREEGYGGVITIDSIGTGAGFERFCKSGETDISNASRAIKDSEKESCAAIGRTPVEFRVGTDALAVVVSKENTFLKDVTLAQLAQIFSTAEKWSDVDPSWPAETILRFSPGTDSGTFDYFVEAVMTPAYEKDAAKGEEAILQASGTQFSEDDNVLVQGVEGSPYAIGYFGFAYYEGEADRLNILSIEGVTPDAQTAEDGSYPLARPLFIYSDPTILLEKPQVAAFINFYLSMVNDEILDVGYFPASENALTAAMQNWLDAMK
jgi:phosphate binding protein